MNTLRLTPRLTSGFVCLMLLAPTLARVTAAQGGEGVGMGQGHLNIKVITTDGSSVVGVVIRFEQPGTNTRHRGLLEEDNGEILEDLKAGAWKLYALKTNYEQVPPKPKTVGVSADHTGNVNLSLAPPTPTPTPRPPRRHAGADVYVRPGRDTTYVVLILAPRQDRGVEEQEVVAKAENPCGSAPAQTPARGGANDKSQSSMRGRVVTVKAAKSGDAGGVKPVADAQVSLSRINVETSKEDVLGEVVSGKDGCFNLTFTLPQAAADEQFLFSVSEEDYKSHVELLDHAGLDARTNSHQPITLEALPRDAGEPERPLLETREATRRHVFAPEVMEVLPLPGMRNFDEFALLTPGVAPPPDTPNARGPGVSPGLGTAGQFSVNGLRPRDNNFTVDGSDNNDEEIGARRQGFVALAPLPVESLNEFQIITALPDARYGRNIGGYVNALTKGGTSKFHGSVYGYATDSRLNARGPFDQTTGDNPASFTLERESDGADVWLDGRPIISRNPVGGENPLTRTQVGFVLGGPFEKLGAFFFTSLERLESHASRESHFVVPTVEQRGAFDAGATGLLLERPDELPPLTLSATTAPGDAVFSLYPFPNNPLGPFGHNTYTTVLPTDAQGTRFSAKLDRQFGSFDAGGARPPWSFFNGGDTLSGRYSSSREESVVPVTGEALFSSLRPKVRTQNVAFFLDRSLTRRIGDAIRVSVGHTRLTFDEVRDPFLSPSSFFPGEKFLLNAPLLLNVTAPRRDGTLRQPVYLSAWGAQGAALLDLSGYPGVTHAEQITGALGQVIIPGFSPLGVDAYHFPQSRANTTVQAADTVTFAPNSGHIFTFGADIRKTLINSTLDRNFRPLAVFNGLRTSTPASGGPLRRPGVGSRPVPSQVFSGTTLAAAGVPTGLFQTLAADPNSTVGIRFTQADFFAQSDWRVRDNLHLSFGLRLNYLTELNTKGNTVERAFDPSELGRRSRAAVEDCVRVLGSPAAVCEAATRAIISSVPADFTASFGGDRYDLDQRVGFAWEFDDKTVVRGGFGIYSGEFPGIVVGQLRDTFPNFLPLNFAGFPVSLDSDSEFDPLFLSNPANPTLRASGGRAGIFPNTLNTLAPGLNAISFLITRSAFAQPLSRDILGLKLALPQKHLNTPYSMQYGVTLERKLSSRYALSVAYVGTRGVKLLRSATPDGGLNYSRLLDLSFTDGLDATLLNGTLLPPQAPAPEMELAVARTLFESSAYSTYNSLQVEVRKHYAERFQFRTAFTYSHAIDDASDFFDTAGAFALPQNSLRRSERGSSNFDVRLRSVTHFIKDYLKDLVFFGPRRLGGWQFAGIVTAQTGQPFTVNSAFDINRDGNLTDRLNTTDGLIQGGAAGDRSVQLKLAPGTNPFDLLAADGNDGAVGRNTFRAPGLFSFDLSVTKFFNFNDRVRLHARTEIFNLFNRTNFGIPVRILESPAFGRSTYTTTPPRTIQLVVRLHF